MPDNPHTELYGKEVTEEFVQEHLSGVIETLQQIANYSSNAFLRFWLSSGKRVEDTILIGTLFKHALTMFDSIIVLLRQGCVTGATLQLRSLFEASVYLQWIAKEDSENRAAHYFVATARKELDWIRAQINGRPEHSNLIKILGDSSFQESEGINSQENLLAQESAILRQLESDFFKLANDHFEALRSPKGKRKFKDVEWYVPLKMSSLFDICENLSMVDQYRICYASDSQIAHANSQARMISQKNKNLVFHPVRDLRNYKTTIVRASTEMIKLLHLLLQRYRHEEISGGAFSRKFEEEWQDSLKNIPDLNVTGNGYSMI